MADLSKIKLNGTDYNLKDNWARENFVEKENVLQIFTLYYYPTLQRVLTWTPLTGEEYFILDNGITYESLEQKVPCYIRLIERKKTLNLWRDQPIGTYLLQEGFESLSLVSPDLQSSYTITEGIEGHSTVAIISNEENTHLLTLEDAEENFVQSTTFEDAEENFVKSTIEENEVTTTIFNKNDSEDSWVSLGVVDNSSFYEHYVGITPDGGITLDSYNTSGENSSVSRIWLLPDNIEIAASTVSILSNTEDNVYITNVAEPTEDTDAVNKQYVDTAVSGITIPVTSVNGQTGNVSLTIPTVPTNVSSFTNDAGYITSAPTIQIVRW